MDEDGALALVTEHGPGVLRDQDLGWVLERLRASGKAVEEDDLSSALGQRSGESTALQLRISERSLAVVRVDAGKLPGHWGFVREPVG